MRIAFAGASGTGKTTLAKYVAETFNLPFNPIGSRSVAKDMGFDSPYDVDKAGRRGEFQRRLVRSKVEWETTNESFVTDRTTADNLAYTCLHDVYSVDHELIELVKTGIDRYTHIFLCYMDTFFALGSDPFRVSNPCYHEVYESILLSFVNKYNTKSLVIKADGNGLEKRAAHITQQLIRYFDDNS